MLNCLFYKEITRIEEKLCLLHYKELEETKEELYKTIEIIFNNELERRKLK